MSQQASIEYNESDKKKGRAQEIDKHIGKKLRKFRKMKRLTQEDLGTKLGVSFQQIQKYENGKNRITFGRLFELSSFLNVPLESFVADLDASIQSQYGLADGQQQSSINGYEAEDEASQKDIAEFMKAYHSIKDPQRRASFVKLAKDMAKNMKE